DQSGQGAASRQLSAVALVGSEPRQGRFGRDQLNLAAPHPTMRIIQSIAEEHAEEAAFLWLLRDRSVVGPRFRLKDLVRLDARIAAHLDGLRFADQDGWAICRAEADAHDEPGEVFAAGVLAFESENLDRVDAVLDMA